MELVVRSEDYLSYRQDGGVVLFDPRDLRKTFFLIILKASGVLIDITDVHTDRQCIPFKPKQIGSHTIHGDRLVAYSLIKYVRNKRAAAGTFRDITKSFDNMKVPP